jgi:hypothetical protein
MIAQVTSIVEREVFCPFWNRHSEYWICFPSMQCFSLNRHPRTQQNSTPTLVVLHPALVLTKEPTVEQVLWWTRIMEVTGLTKFPTGAWLLFPTGGQEESA